jgi:fructose/tagatose bisphosphate aldolase
MFAETLEALQERVSPWASRSGEGWRVDGGRFEDPAVLDRLIYDAVFHSDEGMRREVRALLRTLARARGVHLASIHELYMARGRGECSGFTVPAFNLRALTYDKARAAFQAAQAREVGAFIFEIARSEMGYSHQRPDEYAVCILAAAVREGFRGPVFLQGDHFQVKPSAYAKDPEAEVQALKELIAEAIAAGFYNIDIDASTMVDLSQPTLEEQQRRNFELTALLAAHVRELEPRGVTISIGGEIGEVGGKNSTVEELEAFVEGFQKTVREKHGDFPGLSKISVQTGTTHGGVPLPDGRVAEVKLDFDVLERLSRVARERYGMAGAVQHGASTLPEEAFDHFPRVETAEVHLATGFQNLMFESPAFPAALREEMYAYLKERHRDEWKEGMTEEQFLYKTRKKATGPFKQRLWDLPEETRGAIREALRERFGLLYDKLRVGGTRDLVARYVPAGPEAS